MRRDGSAGFTLQEYDTQNTTATQGCGWPRGCFHS